MVLNKVRKRSAAILGLVAAVAVGISGCASSSSAEPGAAKMTDITIGLPVPASTLAAVYVAEAKGYFKAQGLNVKALTFKGDGPLVKAALSGSIDIAIGSLAGVITSAEAKQDVKVFYGGFNMPGFSWYGAKGIDSLAQGEGKNWGITTFGSSTDLLTRYVLSQKGLDPDKDVNIVQAGTSPSRLAAMSAGQLQVSILSDPTTFAADRAGLKDILDLKDVVKDYPMHVAWTTGAYLKKNPTVIKEFIAALSKGMSYTKSDQKDAANIMAAATKFDPADALKSVEGYQDELFPDGRMVSKAGLDAFFNMSISGGLFKSRPADSSWLVTTYLPK